MTIDKELDPRTKLIIVSLISTISLLIKDTSFLIVILIASFILAWILRVPVKKTLKKIKGFLGIFIVIIVLQSLFMPSEKVILKLGGLSLLTQEGVKKGIELALRLTIIFTSATLMTTSNSRDIVQGLIQWKIPYEIPFMVLVGIRFLPMLIEELKDAVIAIQLRGIEFNKIPISKRIKVYSYILMPVVANVLLKARKLSMAMETRGFGIYGKRTSYRRLYMSKIDYIAIVLAFSGSILLTVFYFTTRG